MSTRLHAAPNRPKLQSINPRAFIWPLTSKRPRRWAFLCRTHSLPGRTRCGNEPTLVHYLLGAAFAWPLGARWQPSDRTRRIAMLSGFAAGDAEPKLGLQLCSGAKFEL